MSEYLDRINEANDIKKIEPEAYDALASEIRSFIIESVSEHGGHLASNLGVVELTMALHLCLDFPNDKLIWLLNSAAANFGFLNQSMTPLMQIPLPPLYLRLIG